MLVIMKNHSLKDYVIPALILFLIVFFIYGLGSSLVPLAFSWFLAYASLPLVKKIQNKGCSRSVAASLVLGAVTLVILLLGFLIIPPLVADIQAAVLAAPQSISVVLEKLDVFFSNYDIRIPYQKESLIEFAKQYSTKLSSGLLNSASDVVRNSILNTASAILLVLNLFLIPIFFVYLVTDYENLIRRLESLVPLSWRPYVYSYGEKANRILSGYIRGQMLVCLILGVLYSLGLLIVGLKFALVIGFLTGFFSIIPYVGYTFGFAAALITTFANFESWGQVVGVIIAYSLVQMLESFVITPRIVGNKVGLSSFEAIISLIVLGNLLGFIGLFLAIPVGALVKTALIDLLAEYKKTALYKG